MNAPIANSITALIPELTEIRQDFHRYPELQYDVNRTAGIVAEKLHEYGFDEIIEGVGKTGVVGLLHGKNGAAKDKSSQILFRADMDALPINEASGVEYASLIPGKMHACGHDGHTTMLLGAAKHLAETRDFDGTIVFCFQPAEEGGAGAKAMIDDGLLTRWKVKGAYALHNWPEIPVGQFGVIPGQAMASADRVIIDIIGKGGHGAQPHLARDPVLATAHLITALQSIVSRVVNPIEPAVVSVTAVNGGEAFNVIPDKVQLKCGIRTFSADVRKLILEEIDRICEHICQAMGTRIEVSSPESEAYPPTVNHPAETELAIGVMRKISGEEGVVTDHPPVMGSEDFAFILQEVPGCYGFIGNGPSAPLHHPEYDFDDGALPFGVSYWTELAKNLLPST